MGNSVNLINIEGKPVNKLIEEVSSAVGTLYRPRAIRNEADSEAYRIKVLAEAEATRIKLIGEASMEIEDRINERLSIQELKNQLNIESIVGKAFKYLDVNVSEEPINEDWKTRFFNKSKEVSNGEIQELWARILAGEVSKPGTVSMRTINVVSNLSKEEALKFQIACSLASLKKLIWKFGNTNSFDEFGITYNDVMMLRDAGLFHPSDTTRLVANLNTNANKYDQIIGNSAYYIESINGNTSIPEFNMLAFTTSGEELCKMIDMKVDSIYIERLIANRRVDGFELTKFASKVC